MKTKKAKTGPKPRAGVTATRRLGDVRVTDDEFETYQGALREGESLSSVIRNLLNSWAKRRAGA